MLAATTSLEAAEHDPYDIVFKGDGSSTGGDVTFKRKGAVPKSSKATAKMEAAAKTKSSTKEAGVLAARPANIETVDEQKAPELFSGEKQDEDHASSAVVARNKEPGSPADDLLKKFATFEEEEATATTPAADDLLSKFAIFEEEAGAEEDDEAELGEDDDSSPIFLQNLRI